MLELKNDEAQIFKNFNKFNSKKMRVAKDDSDRGSYNQSRNQKGGKKKKERGAGGGNKKNKNKNYDSEDSEDLDGLYHYLTVN